MSSLPEISAPAARLPAPAPFARLRPVPFAGAVLTYALGLDLLDILLKHVSFGGVPAFLFGIPLLAFGIEYALRRLAQQQATRKQAGLLVGVGSSANVLTLAHHLAFVFSDGATLVTVTAMALPLMLLYVSWGTFWLRYWAKSD